jgi:hypothetical protein
MQKDWGKERPLMVKQKANFLYNIFSLLFPMSSYAEN